MDKKQIMIYGIVLVVIQCLISCGIFVTYPQMVAYAASNEDIQVIHNQLQRIELKLDKLILEK